MASDKSSLIKCLREDWRFSIRDREREAAEKAILGTREFWLEILQTWLDETKNPDPDDLHYALYEIRRLRRLLGITPSAETRRAQNRDRVRRFRQRKRARLKAAE